MNTRSPAGLATKQFCLLKNFSLLFINIKVNVSQKHSKNVLKNSRLSGIPVNEIIFSKMATLVTYFWQSFGRTLEMHVSGKNRPHPEVMAQSF